MTSDEITVVVSVIAMTLSIASFCGAIWQVWRNRPRLVFYVSMKRFHNRPDDTTFEMMQIKACNIGYRPIIVTNFMALGDRGSFHMGMHDEPAATYGIEDQRFPSIVEPGKTLTFHPMTVDAIKRNATDPKDPKVLFNPYLYLVLVDSFGRWHRLNMNDVLWNLRLLTKWKRTKGFSRFWEYCKWRVFMFRAKRRAFMI